MNKIVFAGHCFRCSYQIIIFKLFYDGSTKKEGSEEAGLGLLCDSFSDDGFDGGVGEF
ncbi:hypothetical protein GCM10023331_16360 [Algivirga pacifica]|uniref:Uncharacterized protein n=1 Tax=Algivirga pacifica TaxID=1162670 RepID=A0ABP9D6B0_9BACT